MSIISPNSGLSPRRQSRGKVPEVYGGKDLWKKDRFWAESEKREGVKEGRIDDDVHELPCYYYVM